MARKKTFFISTSIPYVNSVPHIGHALEFVQADVIARYRRLLGDDVFFLSGTDDNALKNVQAAEKAGRNVSEFVAENAKRFEDLEKSLLISTDDFIRTSIDQRHIRGAQKLWSACKPEDIYKKKYSGLYCVGCEEFKKEKDLQGGECPEHIGKKLESVEEENYFFKLSNYQKELEEIIASDTIQIIPKTRKNETLSFIRGGLEDFSISRSKERARGWGISVPGDNSQMMYVWFDALSNYINALGYADDSEKFKKYWTNGDERVHVVGKGINRFHSIYWPAMLLSAGVGLPTKIFIHGYVTVDGKKISKTLGNVIDPVGLINEYGPEALRYFLLREIQTFEDGDFAIDNFKQSYNANLANGIGNLVSRIMKLAEINIDKPPISIPDDTPGEFKGNLESYELQKAVNDIWERISNLDSFIQENRPFDVVKQDKERGMQIITEMVQGLNIVAGMLSPFLPESSSEIRGLIRENQMPAKPLFPRKN